MNTRTNGSPQRRSLQVVSLCTALLALLLAPRPAAAQGAGVVYQNTFADGAGAGLFGSGVTGGWAIGRTSVTPSGQAFLGHYWNEVESLTLNNLPPHSRLVVLGQFYTMLSWDGNVQTSRSFGTIGPDIFRIDVDGGPVLLNATFSNSPNSSDSQSYPANYPDGSSKPGTDSIARNTLGYTWRGAPMDSIYLIAYNFPHTGSSVKINFRGISPSTDTEAWGLDNVQISVQ